MPNQGYQLGLNRQKQLLSKCYHVVKKVINFNLQTKRGHLQTEASRLLANRSKQITCNQSYKIGLNR